MTQGVRVILQARLTSARLPCKALLRIGGIPMVVLAARRAARSGLALVVATSTDPSDDLLASTARDAGLAVVRGSLDDVYVRFLTAAAGLTDETVIVRLTADNLFPDADLIGTIVARLVDERADYVAPRWPDDGLPYGVTAEAFRLGALRRHCPESASDAEHVTAALRRACGNRGVPSGHAWSHLRATVDTAEDFSVVRSVFSTVADPIRIGWTTLCERLSALPATRVGGAGHAGGVESRLTLGAAQLGFRYGVANVTGTPGQAEVSRMIHAAIDHGVAQIDTARLYGESENRIGMALGESRRQAVSLITKLPACPTEDPADAATFVQSSIEASLQALRTDRIDVLLLHRAETRMAAGGAAWDRLLALREAGVLGRLGISVQNPDELDRALADPDVEQVQLPFNVLDRRWGDPARKERLTVHARSVFLQGLLAGAPVERWPDTPGFDPAALLATLEHLVRMLGRRSPADLALAFARSQSWIDSVVVGCETERQMMDNIEAFTRPPLDPGEAVLVRSRLPLVPVALLDPARWGA